ncbi:MAG: DUF1614 domain-containing protein [Oscillospiraceae bacterium]|jgi:hypothetical protein|nr:DUF1614 domain-containing protein [Oscillospiraceae bacterium]
MSVGMILLLVAGLLVIFGVGQRVLDRMRLSDRGALVAMAAIFIGGLIPPITLGPIQFSIGGALVPLAICIYVLAQADSPGDFWRGIIGAVLTAGAIYALDHFLPADPAAITFDPNYLYGIAAGVIAYILGRSRRGAFISAVLGLILVDVVIGIVNRAQGVNQLITIGTGGMLDAIVISGLLAVMLAELVGEIIERIVRGKGRQENEDGAVRDGRRAR